MKRFGFGFIFCAAMILASAISAHACSACFGKSDSSMARSLNASIFTLMGFIGTVLLGAASFFVFLARKASAAGGAEQTSHPTPQHPS